MFFDGLVKIIIINQTPARPFTKHINNIFKEEELVRESVCAKFAHTAGDGKIYQIQLYNLDVIISVGYRVNDKSNMQKMHIANSDRPVVFYDLDVIISVEVAAPE